MGGLRVALFIDTERLLLADSSQSSDLSWLDCLSVSCRPIPDTQSGVTQNYS